MFNGHKPHHPFGRFFLYFAERSGRGCCCAWADKKVGSNVRFSRYAPRNGNPFDSVSSYELSYYWVVRITPYPDPYLPSNSWFKQRTRALA